MAVASKVIPELKNAQKVNIDDLVPYQCNARTHSAEQVSMIARSIAEFGFCNPVLVDAKMNVVAGHGRLLAAKELGLTQVPVVVIDWMTTEQRQAYIIADNEIAAMAGWDKDLLVSELRGLESIGFDLSLTGFTEVEISSLFAKFTVGLTDPDDVPEESERVASRPGDVWLLGSHRIICGDCTDAEVVASVLGGLSPNLMVTDPPYGVSYDASWRSRARVSKAEGLAVGQVQNDTISDWRAAYYLFKGNVAYTWAPSAHDQCKFADALVGSGFEIRNQIIWCKSSVPISRGAYHIRHEVCWYAVRRGATANWHGGRKQNTVWEIPKPKKSETGHSTQKPVECMRRPIENNSLPGECVYEPFSGSGTTIIACEMTGRVCLAVEIFPAYVDMAVRRWQSYTGLVATRESDGARFDDCWRTDGKT